MNIAEKVLQLKQDFDNVYAAGQAAGGVDTLPFLTQARFYSMNDFGKSEVELNLDRVTGLSSLFNESASDDETRINKTVEHLTINSGVITEMWGSFNITNYSDTTLKRITLNLDTSKCTSYFQTFRGRKALEIIDGNAFDFSSVPNASGINNPFMMCVNLAEFRVVANTIKYSLIISSCDKLSADTRQSIIDGLADLTGSTAQTLTLHATVGGKLTDEQKATITAKNWTLVY